MTVGVGVSTAPRSYSATSTSDMLIPVRSSQFKRDVRKARARGKELSKLRAMLVLLIEQKPLADELRLVRTGTHSDLFKE